MATSRIFDVLQSHRFWAMDCSGIKSIPVFTPLFGFSGISAPKISAEVESFKDGTYNYQRHIVKGGAVGSITFTRAATIFDSDFYDWIYYAINGTTASKDTGTKIGAILGDASGPVRRSLMVVQFTNINLADTGGGAGATALNAVTAGIEGALFAGLAGGGGASIALAAGGSAASSLLGAAGFAVGPFAYASWLPGRCWILHDCIPTEYVSASDFDANSAAPSLMNITVNPEWIEEFNFGV